MADRRMFAKSVVESARFLKMPPSTQNLYFHLGLNADDDGIVEAYPVINLIKAHEDDLKVLFSKGFIKILNEDLVSYIADWKAQNKIRADRKKDSIYQNLLLQLEPEVELLERKQRSDVKVKNGPSMDTHLSAQCSVSENSISKDRLIECSASNGHTNNAKYQLGKEYITESEYECLINQYSKGTVDHVITRILRKPYYSCLNITKISEWCAEHNQQVCVMEPNNTQSVHAEQLMKLAKER